MIFLKINNLGKICKEERGKKVNEEEERNSRKILFAMCAFKRGLPGFTKYLEWKN